MLYNGEMMVEMRNRDLYLWQILLMLIIVFCISCTTGWRVVSSEGPEPRYINKIIHAGNHMVLFGGKNNLSTGFNDLWTWTGNKWEPMGAGATRRWDHSYVYMEDAAQIFMFGGRTFDKTDSEQIRIDLNDNWIFKDTGWVELDILSPDKRSSHGLAYRGKDKTAILFGGRNHEKVFDDTWSFNGMVWRKLDISGPKARFGHTLCYDKKSGNIYLFGGHDGKDLLDDYWLFNGTYWVEVESTTRPSPRMAHAMEFDHEGNAILFGGWESSNSVSGEFWYWDGGDWTKINTDKMPQPRLSHAVGFDPSRGEFILFGGSTGFNGDFLSETWSIRSKPEIK